MMASVIVPVYNSKVIGECLTSILSQDYEGFEIIVVDDGSTDGTVEIVKRYPVKLLMQEHRGPAAARNLGARNAAGGILVFTDADCTAEKDWLSEMLKPFKNPEIIGVQGRYKTKQRSLIARFAQYEIEERYERMAKYDYINFIGSYSAAYRKNIFLNEGGFDESFTIASGEDPELSFRLSSKGYKMVFNPNAIVNHIHPDTLVKYLKQKFYRAYWRVALYGKYPNKMLGESYTPPTASPHIALTFVFLFLTLVHPFGILLLVLTTLPISFRMSKKEKKYLFLSPIIIIMRNIVFGLGIFYGLARLRTKRYPRVELIMPKIKGKVLDIGHVSGTLHEELKKNSSSVFGLDIRAKKRENSIVGDAENMPLKDNTFDTILAGELIEHLKTPERFLKECFRIIKPKGTCIITTPNKKSWVNRIAKSSFTDLHFSLFDRETLVKLCTKHGFQVKEVNYLPYTKESSEGSRYHFLFWLRGALHKIVPDSLKEELIVICEK